MQFEIGEHTGEVLKTAVDPSMKYVVSASRDKTVRVWDLYTGKLLNVLRFPIGHLREGQVYAVAISPDGKLVACGGWTGDEWDHTFSIYLFNRESGKLMNIIPGLPEAILHLQFSKDGSYLGASLGEVPVFVFLNFRTFLWPESIRTMEEIVTGWTLTHQIAW